MTSHSCRPEQLQLAELGLLHAVNPVRVTQELRDRRAEERFLVALPAFIEFEGERYNARLINLAHGRALIEALVPRLPVNSTAALHCGTIMDRAAVVWKNDHQIGLKFEASLTEAGERTGPPHVRNCIPTRIKAAVRAVGLTESASETASA